MDRTVYPSEALAHMPLANAEPGEVVYVGTGEGRPFISTAQKNFEVAAAGATWLWADGSDWSSRFLRKSTHPHF